MSKNEHMRAAEQTPAHHLDTRGAASITQGAYGDHGNLELIVADARDGLWVLWCNADPAGSAPVETADGEVAPGEWSRGMRFAEGTRWQAVEIVQSIAGPDHLEVLALDDDGTVWSWFWSPGPGFQRRQGVVTKGASAIALAHEDGVLTATASLAGGAVRHLRADASEHPHRDWVEAGDGPGLVHEEALAALAAAGVARESVTPGTARRARSTRFGGADELVWRDTHGTLRHLTRPA